MATDRASYLREWHKQHPENVKRSSRRYYELHADDIRVKALAYYHANRDWALIRMRGRRFAKAGINQEAYDRAVEEQGGVCAICGNLDPGRFLAADHDHATGAFRGALCRSCNLIIGHALDDPEVLRSAIRYLERSKT